MQYVMTASNIGPYNWNDVLEDLWMWMDDDAQSNEDIWTELADVMLDLAQNVHDTREYNLIEGFFNDYGFQNNKY